MQNLRSGIRSRMWRGPWDCHADKCSQEAHPRPAQRSPEQDCGREASWLRSCLANGPAEVERGFGLRRRPPRSIMHHRERRLQKHATLQECRTKHRLRHAGRASKQRHGCGETSDRELARRVQTRQPEQHESLLGWDPVSFFLSFSLGAFLMFDCLLLVRLWEDSRRWSTITRQTSAAPSCDSIVMSCTTSTSPAITDPTIFSTLRSTRPARHARNAPLDVTVCGQLCALLRKKSTRITTLWTIWRFSTESFESGTSDDDNADDVFLLTI